MNVLAEKIRAKGMRPGIWVRPLCGSLQDPPGRLLPAIPGRDNPLAPVLDPTLPENLDRIKKLFSLYPQWGYELIKHDFTTWDLFGKWGFQMIESRDVTSGGWTFNDSSRTNAEIILALYGAIRESAGGTYLIGCNTISHLSAGIFELQRIGDDTSGLEWERTRKMGVNTLGFRIPQHLSFYSADPDCVGLTTRVPWEKNKQWMQLVAESGTPLFISAQKAAVGKEQREYIRGSFKTASESNPSGEPLDWLIHQFPSKWRLLDREVQFNWD
jgi:alpha-galactosidase